MLMSVVVRCTLLACALAASAAGCTTAPTTSRMDAETIANGQAFSMRPHDQVLLSDRSRLHYVGVQSDSRCPPDVQCIHAGNAMVGFQWQPAGGSALTFQLSTPEPPQTRDLGSLRLTLLSLTSGAAPQVRLRIERAP